MNLRSKDRSLYGVSRLVIQKRSCDFIKDCQEGLLKSVIFNIGNRGMNLSDILKQICEQILLKNFPRHIVENVLEALCERGELRKEGDKYFIEEEEFERIVETIKKRREIFEKLESKIIINVKRKDESNLVNPQMAVKIFQNFIYSFLLTESNFIADILFCRNVHEISSSTNILDNILSEVEDAEVRKVIRRSIIEALGSTNEKFIHTLYEAILNLISLRMFSIDPSGSLWEKRSLSGKTFILDTNVLFALIIPDHPQHTVTNKMISITKKLGVKYTFTRRTKQEWLEVLEKANQRFRFLSSTRPSLLEKVEDIFIHSYFKRRETDPSLTWREYYSKMKQIEDLARTSGIQLCEEKEEYVSDAASLKILEYLSDEVYRSGRKRLNARFIKSRFVSEHDAYHLLLVRRIREKSSSRSRGPSYWFLTYDVSLLEADKALNVFLKSPHAAPSSLLVDNWILISSLFLDDCVEVKKLVDIFADLFRAYFVTPLRKISASMIVEILNPYLSYKSLSDDDLKAVLDDDSIKQLYFKLREARSIDPEKARFIYSEMRQRVDGIVWRLLEERAKETGVF